MTGRPRDISRALALMVARAGGRVVLQDDGAAVAYSFRREDDGSFVLVAKKHGAR